MSSHKDVLLGVCPIGKFIFSHEDAMKQKVDIFKKLDSWKVRYCSLEDVLPDGMIRDQSHVKTVVDFFRGEKIDALFIPHCNFGTEGAAAMIAKKLGVPVLLWGPRDEAPLEDGTRLRDSLCGMFATSKVLKKLGVPFTYIENCRVSEKKLEEGVSLFMRAAAVVKAVHSMRIGQIGNRIDFFWSTIDNESELLEKFGIEVQPVDTLQFTRAVLERYQKNKSKYEDELKDIKKWLDTTVMSDESSLVRSLALRDEFLHLADEYDLDALSVQSFHSIQKELGPGMGLAYVMAQDKINMAVESDLHGAISSVILKAASINKEPVFFPDIVSRHPENDNAVLLWHGPAPLSLKHPECKMARVLPPWTFKGLPPINVSFRLKDGPITICRFDGDGGEYFLGAGQGKTVEGPYTREFYAWMEVDNWPRWERMLIEGSYIHHCSCIYEHCADVFKEACKYIPGLKAQRFDME